MKSERGVSLISLAIYIVAITVVVGIVATITAYFYTNTSVISEASTAIGQYNIFNLAMLTEVKTEGNSVFNISDNNTRILFKTGNAYTFQDNGIYKNKSKICSDITDCKFKKVMQEEKEVVIVYFEMKDFAKTTQYVISESRQNSEVNFD